MKKLIPALLALCFLLSSCGILSLEYTVTGDTTQDLSVSTPVTSYTEIPSKTPVTLPALSPELDAEKQLSTLPDMDFAKKYFGENPGDAVAYFTIATVNDAPVFASADEISGSSVASALNAVEEKYNLDIVNTAYTAEELDANLKESQLSGKYFADLLSLPAETAKTYATAKYCKTLSYLPFISEDAPYFINDLFEYGGDFSKYAVMSRASYLTKDLCCLYFDVAAVPSDIYTKALDGSLSWEYVFSLMDEKGRGISSAVDFEGLFRMSCGARYGYENGKSVLKVSPFVTTADMTVEDALKSATTKALSYVSDSDPIFVIDTLGSYSKYTSDSTRYGMLPLPNADGNTYGYVSPDKVNYFLCPNYTTTMEGAGIVISALGAATSQREANTLLNLIRDNARDNGTLLVSHLLFAPPAWDSEY